MIGDAFPSCEVILEDPSGQRIFLGAHVAKAVTGKSYPLFTGPLTSLWFKNARSMGEPLNLFVSIDENGNFSKIEKQDVVEQDGYMTEVYQPFGIIEWNYLFERCRFEDPILERYIIDDSPLLIPNNQTAYERIIRRIDKVSRDIFIMDF